MKLTHEQGKELVTPNTFFKKLYGFMRTHVGNNVPMAAERAAWFMFAGGTHMISQNFIISNGQAFIPERFKAMERMIFAPATLGIEDIMSLLFYKRMNKYQGWQGKYQTIWSDLYNGGKLRSFESTSKNYQRPPEYHAARRNPFEPDSDDSDLQPLYSIDRIQYSMDIISQSGNRPLHNFKLVASEEERNLYVIATDERCEEEIEIDCDESETDQVDPKIIVSSTHAGNFWVHKLFRYLAYKPHSNSMHHPPNDSPMVIGICPPHCNSSHHPPNDLTNKRSSREYRFI